MPAIPTPDSILEIPTEWEPLTFSDGSLVLNGFSGTHLKLAAPHPALKLILDLADGTRAWRDIRAQVLKRAPVTPAYVDRAAAEFIERRILRRKKPAAADARIHERFSTQLEWLEQFTTRQASAESRFEKLRESTVTVIGLGGSGSLCAMMLAACGVGRLRLVDGDQVAASNLVRQLFYDEADCGSRSKCEALAGRIRKFSRFTSLETVPRYIESTDDAKDAVAGSDFVLLCADAPRILINRWINEACVEQAIPSINAFSGTVGPVYIPGKSACFNCFEEFLRKQMGEDYDEMVDALQAKRTRQYPSFVGGIPQTAQIQFMECVAVLTEAWSPRTINRSLKPSYHEIGSEEVPRLSGCPSCSTPFFKEKSHA